MQTRYLTVVTSGVLAVAVALTLTVRGTDAAPWTESQKLTASDAERLNQFGWSVSLDGTRAITR